MSKRIPATGPPPRVIHYVQPSPPANNLVNPADVAARRRDQQARYDRWRKRQDAIRRRDRSVRLVLLVIAIVVCAGLLTAAVLVGCTAYRTVTHLGDRAWPSGPASLLPTSGRSDTAANPMPGPAAASGVGR